MSKIVDKDALTYYDSKIKYYANNTSTKNSSQVKTMTGYSKAQTYGAISTSDDLNEAVGKLEYAIDLINDTLESVL